MEGGLRVELWDVYDDMRNHTGRTHARGVEMRPGDYHLVVNVWIRNAKGAYLLSRRAPDKQPFPDLWECTGGSALAGEDSLTAALREVKEELGIALDPDGGRLFRTEKRVDDHKDSWLFDREVDLADVLFQAGETCDARWADLPQLRAMAASGDLAPTILCDLDPLERLTTVYFIRHAQSDQSVHDDRTRPLTAAGMQAAAALPGKLKGIAFDAIYSSPYLRAMQTVTPLAKARRLPILEECDFCERRIGGGWIDNWEEYSRCEWADFGCKHEGGESLGEVQARNLAALTRILTAESGHTVAIGTHGCALSTVLSRFISGFGRDQYVELLPKLPCVYRLTFIGQECIDLKEL